MNDTQRFFVVCALALIGLLIAFLMLDWGDNYYPVGANWVRVLVVYEEPNPYVPTVPYRHGIYTQYGVPGIVLGVMLPLFLFGSAAFVALGRRKK
jgi:hypothetical protein